MRIKEMKQENKFLLFICGLFLLYVTCMGGYFWGKYLTRDDFSKFIGEIGFFDEAIKYTKVYEYSSQGGFDEGGESYFVLSDVYGLNFENPVGYEELWKVNGEVLDSLCKNEDFDKQYAFPDDESFEYYQTTDKIYYLIAYNRAKEMAYIYATK